jgi:hypothetical protein
MFFSYIGVGKVRPASQIWSSRLLVRPTEYVFVHQAAMYVTLDFSSFMRSGPKAQKSLVRLLDQKMSTTVLIQSNTLKVNIRIIWVLVKLFIKNVLFMINVYLLILYCSKRKWVTKSINQSKISYQKAQKMCKVKAGTNENFRGYYEIFSKVSEHIHLHSDNILWYNIIGILC